VLSGAISVMGSSGKEGKKLQAVSKVRLGGASGPGGKGKTRTNGKEKK